MTRFLSAFTLLALACSFSPAQVVGGTEAPPEAKESKQQEAKKSDAEVEAFLKTLTGHIASENAVIRRSAQSAVAAVGTPALPMLKTLSSSENEAVAREAKRLVTRIERSSNRRGGNDRQGRGGRRGGVDQIIEGLKLQPEHEKLVRAQMEKSQTEMRELFQQVRSGEMSREEVGEAMRASREKMLKELGGSLPADKMEAIREAVENMRGRGGRRGGGGRGRGDG